MTVNNHWGVIYWTEANGQNSIEKWLDLLTPEQFKTVAKELKMLELCGNTLRLPHSRSLREGLFELRERKYGFRIYYSYKSRRLLFF